ncbi:MAG TPA: S24/S26 family peptidase [Opitutus sp.]|nr:S24/S26 family peptidase [Opitutus sp.]
MNVLPQDFSRGDANGQGFGAPRGGLRFRALVFLAAATATACLRAEPAADPLADARALATAHQGLRIMRVSGTSMEPFFTDGAVVVVRPLAFARLEPGMLVIYRNRFGETIAHRLLNRTPNGWRAKGQANDKADSSLVTSANLIGVIYATFSPAVSTRAETPEVETVLAAPAR